MERVAVIGDVHGCIDEFKQLYQALQWFSLDEIRVCGDLVDRGPDSGAVVRFCRENNIQAVLGNHEDTVLQLRDRMKVQPDKFKPSDKVRTNQQLTDEDAAWLKALPKLHFYEDLNLVCVHGGLWPGTEMWAQPLNIIRAQMIRQDNPGKSLWWGPDSKNVKGGKSEDEQRADGFERWYRLYDGPWNVVYGHSVFAQPYIHQNPGCGKTIGIDTGSCFGGSLTAMIWDRSFEPTFVSVKARKVHAENTRFSLDEV